MLRYLPLVGFFVIIDQWLKFWAKDFLQYKIYGYEIFDIVGFKLSFYLQKNYGISFSFLSSDNQMPIIGITLLLSFVLVIWLYKTNRTSTKIGLSFILGGALGNIIDRAMYGGVTDFISISYDKYYFPTFNPADVFITLGVVVILLEDIIAKPRNKR